ncbi:MAG: hypothetical protein HQ446_09655 [Polaromonas sp.]|nr:hypothetical protein [Polaromonas sp.]
MTTALNNTTDIDNLYSLIGADPENYKEIGIRKDFNFFSIDWHLERFLDSHATDIPPVHRSSIELAAHLGPITPQHFKVTPAMPTMTTAPALDVETAVFKLQVNQVTKVDISTPASNAAELSTTAKPKLSGLFNRLENGSGNGRREQTLLNLKRA